MHQANGANILHTVDGMIDLRSDLMTPRSPAVVAAMSEALSRPPAMIWGEDPYERELSAALAEELGVEAVLLTPTCTMANQIAIRLHLPAGGRLATGVQAHAVTVERRATALTGVSVHPLDCEGGHPTPAAVERFVRGDPTLVWLENTHMLSAGSVMPAGWQDEIATICRSKGSALHLDGSRLWNAAVSRGAPMADLTRGADTISASLNKALGAPMGSVLAGSEALIQEAVRWREALGGEWRPIGGVAAAALAALDGWRERLSSDAEVTRALAEAIVAELGEASLQPAPTNLLFLNRPRADARAFVEALARNDVGAITVAPGIVRLAIHGGVREREIVEIVQALAAADLELSRRIDVAPRRPA